MVSIHQVLAATKEVGAVVLISKQHSWIASVVDLLGFSSTSYPRG